MYAKIVVLDIPLMIIYCLGNCFKRNFCFSSLKNLSSLVMENVYPIIMQIILWVLIQKVS